MLVHAVTVAPKMISEMTQTSSSSIIVKPSSRRRARLMSTGGERTGAEAGDSLKFWSTAVTQYVCAVVEPGLGST